MASFPIFLDVGDVPPLVVGDGDLAAAKVRTLLLRAPRVALASATVPVSLAALITRRAVEVIPPSPSIRDMHGRPLVVAATENDTEDTRISRLARSLGVPVNVPDRPELCTFTLGAIVDRGDVTVAISTDGAAPMLATHLRHRLEQNLDPRLGRVAAIAREYRDAAEHHVPRGAARRAFWQEVVSGAPAEAILAGDEAKGRRLIEAALEGAPAKADTGRVILVAAGPGDPDLMTLKAVRALKSADVILHDALIDLRVLDHARREAVVIDVGKRAGGDAVPQSAINALLVEHADAGRIVVRLKGGDSLVFGRAAEEIAAVEFAGIAVEIIPGITAAQACAAEARLPLTLRGRIRQISLVAGAAADGETDLDWDALARPGQAFAIYMGVRTAGRITARLLAAGADPSTRVVVVEKGATVGRRTIAATLIDLPALITARRVEGPAIVFVGLDWADAGIEPPAEVDWFAGTRTPRRRPRLPAPIDQFALSS
jgi:uroporphyrin-III C-methyltransferase/precorrin-2 dehydrogenase/sirohydrochlorin ferrochelatase